MSRWNLIGIGSTLLVCVACSRNPEPATAAAPAAIRPPAAQLDASAAATDSSLAIKRGVMTLDEDRTIFRACGSQSDWVVIDQTSEQYTQQLLADAPSAPVSFYVEAYGERASAPTRAPDDAQTLGVEAALVLEEILYAGIEGETQGCSTPPAQYIVSARGNEPFWNVEVIDEAMRWRQPHAPKEIVFGAPQTEHAEGAVRYTSSAAEHRVELVIHAQPCRDSMSGEFFAYTAKAVLDRTEFNGCARVGR